MRRVRGGDRWLFAITLIILLDRFVLMLSWSVAVGKKGLAMVPDMLRSTSIPQRHAYLRLSVRREEIRTAQLVRGLKELGQYTLVDKSVSTLYCSIYLSLDKGHW